MRIHPFDLSIVIAYLLAVTALGMHFRRKQPKLTSATNEDPDAVTRDYFLGGRTAPWWALAFSIVATETSTLTIIGTPAIAYGGNLTFLQLVFGYLIGRVLIVLLLLPGYFRGDFFTAYALIEKRFGQRMRAVAASTFLITRAIAEGVRVSAIALVLSVVLGTSEHLSVVIVIALTLLYTLEGGMKAVIWTDVAQLFIYLAGSAATLFVLLHRIPGGWNEVVQVAATYGHKLQLFDFSFHLATKYTFWSGLIGGAFLTMASHGTDQTIVQRLLAARNQVDSRRALLTSGVIVLVQFSVFLLIGVLLYVFAQHTPLLLPGERADRILPLFLLREMPTGLAGLLLASIIAVAMSNASGSLNSLAASSVLDFSALRQKRREPVDDRSFLRHSRRMTLFWGLVLMCFGLATWGPLLEAGLTVASLPFGSLLGLFLLGTLNRRSNASGALAGMFVGLITILGVWRLTDIAFTWYVLIGSCVTFLVGSLVSFLMHPSGPVDDHAKVRSL
jgi:SSS family transporter